MAGINMMGQHATILAIVCTTFIMNLRHIILSTCVMDKLHDGKRWQRVLLSFFITDEVFALYTSKPKPIDNISYFFGLGLTCWLSWFVGSWLRYFALCDVHCLDDSRGKKKFSLIDGSWLHCYTFHNLFPILI